MPHLVAPPLYLEILGLIAELERAGKRAEADRAGRRARSLYGSAWNAESLRRLELVRDGVMRELRR
jgi:hypothetical protein